MLGDNFFKVSIVMATYNGEAFIKEQLESILNQTYPIHEIIIQDDCSTDNTWDIIKSYEMHYSYLKCYRNDENIRAHETFKLAFAKATGDYIAPADQDDIWLPNKIDVLVNLIGDNLMAHSQSTILYMDNQQQNSFELYNPYVSIENLLFSNYYPGHALLFHKSILPYIALTRNMEISYDHVISIYCMSKKSIVVTNQTLQIWRRHKDVCTVSVKHSNIFSNITERRITGYDKFILTSKKLLKKDISKVISNAFEARHFFFSCLLNDCPGDQRLKMLSQLASLIARQNFISYIRAGLLCFKHRKAFFYLTEGRKFKTIFASCSFAFRYPFTFWYDMQNENCL